MSVRYTYHGLYGTGALGGLRPDALPGQIGNAVVVADGAASPALPEGGYYRIMATSYCLVRIGAEVTNGTNGEYWPSDYCEVRYLAAGQKIGVSAA